MLVAKKERNDTYASKLNPSCEVLNLSHKYCLSQPHPAHAAGNGAGPEIPHQEAQMKPCHFGTRPQPITPPQLVL